ncbi:MAG: GNAT family N-acetyltransferase [Dehalococcoidales bacterium]|nr:GNAT family N-acetyltransferase [Dehalococcoidales bacterium]
MKSGDIVIRKFRMSDYEDVLKLWDEAGIHYRPNGRESRQRIEKEMKARQAIFLVAESQNRIVGVVFGTQDGRRGWINRLAVAKEFRRQGIARKLVMAVENKCTELGIEITACLIEKENAASKKFFARLGYGSYPVEYYSKRRSPGS